MFHTVCLPQILGGYGLGMRSEIREHIILSPEPIHWVVNKLLSGEPTFELTRVLRRLNSAPSTRGAKNVKLFEERIKGELNSNPTSINTGFTIDPITGEKENRPVIDWKWIKGHYPTESGNNREILFLAEKDGFITVEEFAKRQVRGTMFQMLLLEQDESVQNFKTKNIWAEFRKIWDDLENLIPEKSGLPTKFFNLSADELHGLIEKGNPQYFIKFDEVTDRCLFTSDEPFRVIVDEDGNLKTENPQEHHMVELQTDVALKDLYRKGVPSFDVGRSFLDI